MKEQSNKIKYSSSKYTGSGVALGFFDGIHLGHRAVIGEMLRVVNSPKKKSRLCPVVYTFNKNPGYLFGKNTEIITPNEERYRIITDMGVEKIMEDDFLLVKDLSPGEFVEKVLVERFSAKEVFCGFNYHFGKGGYANTRDLTKLCGEYGINVTVVPPVVKDGVTVSSTLIRRTIKEGDMERANLLLGHIFGFSSVIEEGNHIGRLMDTPTINQKLPVGVVIPRFGVYTSVVTVEGKRYIGVTNIGVKPTIGNYLPLSETWLVDYRGKDLYGKTADVRLLSFQREEKKFHSIRDLEEQIKRDGAGAKDYFEKNYKYMNSHKS